MHTVHKTSEERYHSSLKTNTRIFVGPFCRQLNATHLRKSIHTESMCYTTAVEGYSLREDKLVLQCSVKAYQTALSKTV